MSLDVLSPLQVASPFRLRPAVVGASLTAWGPGVQALSARLLADGTLRAGTAGGATLSGRALSSGRLVASPAGLARVSARLSASGQTSVLGGWAASLGGIRVRLVRLEASSPGRAAASAHALCRGSMQCPQGGGIRLLAVAVLDGRLALSGRWGENFSAFLLPRGVPTLLLPAGLSLTVGLRAGMP